VTVQWIGVVAAVIAVGIGLRHLYVEIAEPSQLRPVVERHRIPTNDPASPTVGEFFVEPPETTPPEVTQQPDRAIVATTSVPAPEDPSPVADPIVVFQRVPVVQDPPEPVVHEVTFVQSKQTASLEERLRSSLGEPQELAGPPPVEHGPDEPGFPVDSASPIDSSAEETSSSTAIVPSDPPGQAEPSPRGPLDSVGGVAVLALRWNGRELEADVREDPQTGVTLVTIRGAGGPHQVTAGRPGRRHATATAPGIYYFRVFVGSTAGSLDPGSHGLFGKDLRVVPSGESRSRERRPATSDIPGAFDLPSAVGLDPVWLPARGEPARCAFVAAAGRKLYDVAVVGAPAEFDGWHRMHVGLSHRYSDRRGRKMVELEALVRQDQLVFFRVPDLMLAGGVTESHASVVETILVAFTPLSGAGAESIRATESFFEQDPRGALIAIEGPAPVIPAEILSDPAVLGDLRLRVLVFSSGELGSVVAIETESPRGEYLVEPVVSAVRQWRFHQTALVSTKLGAYFDITVSPDGEMRP